MSNQSRNHMNHMSQNSTQHQLNLTCLAAKKIKNRRTNRNSKLPAWKMKNSPRPSQTVPFGQKLESKTRNVSSSAFSHIFSATKHTVKEKQWYSFSLSKTTTGKYFKRSDSNIAPD